ncbi:probable helicase senataxin [Ylistrum balloti]|uniref:probable helicase senataxin n=1 Tax=Ylistrum balloti TaxID=509963 RepID=UPI0029059DBA|nr:probable helicase senataxin [Ylistrum balloti]
MSTVDAPAQGVAVMKMTVLSLAAPGVSSTGYDTDVQLPNQDEILSKQLPLLTMMEPGVKSTNTSLLSLQPHEDKVEITENQQSLNSSTAPPDKNKANEERSEYIESMGQQDSKYKERSQRPESEISHKKKGSSSSSEQASRRNDSGNKEKSQRPRSGSSGKDHRNREKSQRQESGSNRHDSGNKDRSQRSESGSSGKDSENKERSLRSESWSSRKDSGNKERSPRPESRSSKKDSENKDRSQRSESESSKKDSENKDRSPRPESRSSRKDSENKDRSPRPGSRSSRKDSENKDRSPRPESRSSRKDSENKDRSQKSESRSSKKDSENKDRSPRPESRSSRKDNENKDRSPRPESRSSRKDSENKDRSPRPESRSSRKDSENKDRSQKPESGLGKKDSENKNRSQRSESGSSRKDSENKERSPILESGSSKKHNRKERLSSLESGLSRMENSEIENRNKERPPGQESSKDFSGRIENMNEKMLPSNESGSFNTKFSDPNVEVNLDSVSGNINLDEHHILDMNSRKQTDEMTGTKENRPPAMPEMISNTVNDCSASKACIPSSTAHDILSVPSQPHAGKMIRRKATGPKSILTLPENRRKKPHRKVTFDLQQETPREVPFTSRLARSILLQKERLPLDHQLRGGGKVAQPSRSINQSEGRNATVSCLNQPGSFVRTPQTIPKACTPTSRPQNLMEKKWASTQSHMNKPFTDITGAKNTPEERQYSLDNLLVKLLQWNPVWLQEQEKYSYPPPAIEAENPLIPLGESYSSFDDYIQLFTPHIIMETWETAVSGFKQRKESGVTRHTVHFSAAETSVNKKFIHHTWNGVVTGEKFTSNQYLCDEDLVIIKYVTEEPDPSQPSGPPRYTQRSSFGFLEKVTPYKAQDIPRLYNELPLLRRDAQALGNQNVVTLKLKLKIRNGRNLRLAQQPATLQKVVSLISIVRQYNALVVLRRNILWKHILEPGRTDVFAEEQPVTEALRSQLRNYNPSQQKAICTAAKVAVQPFNLPRICLLQGPPGTGKSHTIVGIIDKIIRDTKGQGRICLCTPSNAAVDEVIRRLIYHKRNTTRAPNHLPYGLHMVRIGKMSSIHKDVAKYTFTELVHRHRQNEISRKGEKNFPQSSRRELASLSEKISALSSQLENMEPGDNSCVHKKRLQADLQKMEQKKTDLHYQLRNMNRSISLTPAEEYEIKKNVLWRAHVICGTLNSFGSSNIQNLLRTRHPSNQSSFFFNCIVMDEASQGTELDCLIPLQYGTSKLIMVGDPEQLSPTVLSRKAEEKCFGQSMFERMYGYYKYKETSPVILLDTQYRMNPEIAIFPSQFVYGGRLLSDRCVEERGHNFPLKPYLVFNVEEGQEQSSQAGSVKNEAEACFVAMLCKQITRYTDIPQTDIGIIAPYQSQKSLLVENLKQWKMTSIEVGTVDGFQGREKEVIIMSCVRASSSGGIGFVANRKRMNVALTRARSAMYVVGNLSSLKRSGGDWEVLIEDARKRKVVQDCGKQTNYSTAVQVCFKRLPT